MGSNTIELTPYSHSLQDLTDERPAPIIHRNFDDVYSGSGTTFQPPGNPLSMIQNFNIPLPSLPEASSPEAAILSKPKCKDLIQALPVFPGVTGGQTPVVSSCSMSDHHNINHDCNFLLFIFCIVITHLSFSYRHCIIMNIIRNMIFYTFLTL